MSRRALIETKFCRAPTTLLLSTMNTWVSQSTSFPKGFISIFLRTLFLFINCNNRHPPQDPSVFVDKTVMPNPRVLSGHARICACAIGGRASMRRSLSPWLAPCKKGNDKKTHPTPHFDSRKIYGPTNLEKPTDHGKEVI